MIGKLSLLDSPETSLKHANIVKRKKFLKRLYIELYQELLGSVPRELDGKIVELGSGGGFIKELDNEVITSDIMDIPGLDMKFPAEQMPFPDNSVKAFLGLNVLHHVKNIERAFEEIDRCLIRHGVACFIEPSNTKWGRFVYKNFHHERFDPAASWENQEKGPLSGANIALPWIIFIRDRSKFRHKFPTLQIDKLTTHTPFSYLMSGGFKSNVAMPEWLFGVSRFFDKLFSTQGMFFTIKLCSA